MTQMKREEGGESEISDPTNGKERCAEKKKSREITEKDQGARK